MRKLTNLLFGFLFIPALAFSQKDSLISKYDSLFYKKFKKEMEKADTLDIKLISLTNVGLANMYKYDLNKDGITDVMQIYTLKYSVSKGRLEQSENPLFYILDINGDRNIGYEEFLIDEKMDGLNGNEEFSNLLQSKKQKVIKREL